MKQKSKCGKRHHGCRLPWFVLWVAMLAPFAALAQRVLVEWNFPTNSADAIADGGTAANVSRVISAEGGVGNVIYSNVVSVAGWNTFSAYATGWNGGADTKYWMIELTSVGYRTLTLSSRQRSSNAGPADFKVQYRIGEGDWYDVLGGAFTVSNNWTTGVLVDFDLPPECDDQVLLSIRWIMTSNTRVSGEDQVSLQGVSQIDDITVRGTRLSIPAPQALPATDVSASQFTANWLPVDDVDGYQLDVATTSAFQDGVPLNLVQNPGFETGDKTGWSGFGFIVSGDAPHDGDYAIGCAPATQRSLIQNIPITAADGTTSYVISYWYRVASGDGTDVRIWSAWSPGPATGDNLQPTTYNPSTNVWTRMVYTNIPAAGTTNLRFEVRVYSNATVSLDSFSVHAHGFGDYIPGYQSRVVSCPGHRVEGLVKGTYYYRVRAVDGAAASGDSAVIRVRAADSAPGFLLISR